MIRCVQVSKRYPAGRGDELAALSDVNLCLNGEGAVVFRGPSGSGKTTLLRLLGCLSRPSSGRIWIDDREVSGLSEGLLTEVRRECFGFVFQDFQLIHGLSALMNVMVPLYPSLLRWRALRGRAMELLAELELAPRASERVEHLSAGEQQRVALARALVNNPRYLVADEPTAHLDTRLSGRFLGLVEDLKRQGRTVLIASHDPLVCESAVTSRVVALRDGRIQGEAVP